MQEKEKKESGKKERKFEISSFKPKNTCDACGCTDVSIKYRSAKAGREEHLKKICTACGFVWRERPKWVSKPKDL